MDGMLSLDEFCLAMYLIDHKLAGNDLPDYLPSHLVPDSSIQNEQENEFFKSRLDALWYLIFIEFISQSILFMAFAVKIQT